MINIIDVKPNDKLKRTNLFSNADKGNRPIDFNDLNRLLECFPGSFIKEGMELMMDKQTNAYISLINCKTVLDIKCKILEQLSREASSSLHFKTEKKNNEYHQKLTDCINDYLGTDFSINEMNDIYCYLGNGINHEKTKEFVLNDYSPSILIDKEINNKDFIDNFIEFGEKCDDFFGGAER